MRSQARSTNRWSACKPGSVMSGDELTPQR
jgi:hypothetical protein